MKKNILFIATSLILVSLAVAQPQVDQGKDLLKQGKYLEAVNYFRNSIKSDLKNDQLWVYLGQACYGAKMYDSAIVAATQAKMLNDENPDAYAVLAQSQLALKQNQDAYAITKAGLKAAKDYEPLIRVLGQIYLAMDSTDAATVAFTKASDINANDPEAYEGLGDAYAKTNVTSLAIMNYQKSLSIDSTRAVVWYKMASTYQRDRQWNESARGFEKVIQLNPNNYSARLDVGMLYYRAGLPGYAVMWLKPYVEKYPDSIDVAQKLLDALFKSRQYKDVIPLAQRLFKINPKSADILRMLAYATVDGKDYRKGIQYYLQLQSLDTLKVDDWRKLALAYVDTKQDSLAASAIEEILKVDSTNTAMNFELAVIQMRMRQWAKAADNFEKRFKADTANFSAYYNYGSCKSALGEFEDAAGAYVKAIALKPGIPGSYFNLGSCYMQLKEWDKAKDTYEQYIKVADTVKSQNLKEPLATAYKFIGLVYLLDKKYEDVVKYEKKSIELNDNDTNAHTWLGQAYHNMPIDSHPNARKDAIAEYKKALKIDKNNKEAWKLLNMLEPQ